MVSSKGKRGLGRGLSALMADIEPTETDQGSTNHRQPKTGPLSVSITKVHANPDQPRKTFVEDELQDLARSISEKGIIQPLIVRPDTEQRGEYQIVAGERRWRAAQLAKVDEVPVLIRDLNDQEVLEIAIIENVQRADLNPVDEASGYQQLMNGFGHTQEKLSQALGKSRSHIANTLRLLNLPESVLDFLRDGRLTPGHARALITTENPGELAREAVARGLSVRQVEALARRGPKEKRKPQATSEKDSDTRSIEADLSANLKMKVQIDHKTGSTGGRLTVNYTSFDELDELCRILSVTHSAGSR